MIKMAADPCNDYPVKAVIISGMGIVHGNTNFRGSETDSKEREKKMPPPKIKIKHRF